MRNASRHLQALAIPAHYAAAIDAVDWPALAALFADDVVVTSGWGKTVGKAATVDGFATRATAFTRQFHWLANQRALALDVDRARVACYFFALVDLQSPASDQVLFRGAYDFDLVWHGCWLIASLCTTYHDRPVHLDRARPADDVLAALHTAASPGYTRGGKP